MLKILVIITIILTFLFGSLNEGQTKSGGNQFGQTKSGGNQSQTSNQFADVFCSDLKYGTKNVLIVDVANLYGSEDNGMRHGQTQVFKEYIKSMKNLYTEFYKTNEESQMHFVMKNYKIGGQDGAPKIGEDIWKQLKDFVEEHPNALISVVEDYKTYEMARWKDPKNHYLRGADDYVCFLLSQEYKKGYKLACIMSNDKFKDFPKLHFIPPFVVKRILPKADTQEMSMDPSKHKLGQFVDYRRVPISYDFSFADYRVKNRL